MKTGVPRAVVVRAETANVEEAHRVVVRISIRVLIHQVERIHEQRVNAEKVPARRVVEPRPEIVEAQLAVQPRPCETEGHRRAGQLLAEDVPVRLVAYLLDDG